MIFYSGHRHFHFLISQIIIDNWNNTRFIQTGFLGNLFDSMTYRLMTPVGPGRPMDLPFRQQRIRQMRARTKRRARRLNQTTKPSPRVSIEHTIKHMKTYKAVGSLWRHPRGFQPIVVELCTFLAQRYIELFHNVCILFYKDVSCGYTVIPAVLWYN